MKIAYRLETARLVLRCFRPEDAALRKDAVDASLLHLSTLSSYWSREPEPLTTHLAKVRANRGAFDLDQDHRYAVFDPTERRLLGEVSLLSRAGFAAREVGYWARADELRKGQTTEAVMALAKVGFELLEVDRLDLRCAVTNAASAAVARKVGFTFEGTLRHQRRRAEDPPEDGFAFSMTRSDYAASPAASAPLRAFDIVGAALL